MNFQPLNFDFMNFQPLEVANVSKNCRITASKIVKLVVFENTHLSKSNFTENPSGRELRKFPHCALCSRNFQNVKLMLVFVDI